MLLFVPWPSIQNSTWNDTFNAGHRSQSTFLLGFIPGLIKACLFELYLILSGKLDRYAWCASSNMVVCLLDSFEFYWEGRKIAGLTRLTLLVLYLVCVRFELPGKLVL